MVQNLLNLIFVNWSCLKIITKSKIWKMFTEDKLYVIQKQWI